VAQNNANERLKGKRDQFTDKKKKPVALYVVVSIVAVAIVGVVVAYAGGGKAPGRVEPTAVEAQYIGRYLPDGFKPVKLTEPVVYDRQIDMTPWSRCRQPARL